MNFTLFSKRKSGKYSAHIYLDISPLINEVDLPHAMIAIKKQFDASPAHQLHKVHEAGYQRQKAKLETLEEELALAKEKLSGLESTANKWNKTLAENQEIETFLQGKIAMIADNPDIDSKVESILNKFKETLEDNIQRSEEIIQHMQQIQQAILSEEENIRLYEEEINNTEKNLQAYNVNLESIEIFILNTPGIIKINCFDGWEIEKLSNINDIKFTFPEMQYSMFDALKSNNHEFSSIYQKYQQKCRQIDFLCEKHQEILSDRYDVSEDNYYNDYLSICLNLLPQMLYQATLCAKFFDEKDKLKEYLDWFTKSKGYQFDHYLHFNKCAVNGDVEQNLMEDLEEIAKLKLKKENNEAQRQHQHENQRQFSSRITP